MSMGSRRSQRAVYELGMTGSRSSTSNNNCSLGFHSALHLPARAIRGELADCAIALGFEKMQPGSLGAAYDDRAQLREKHFLQWPRSPKRCFRRRRGCLARRVAIICSNTAALALLQHIHKPEELGLSRGNGAQRAARSPGAQRQRGANAGGSVDPR